MPEQIWFTHILNALFAAPVGALFHLLGVPVKYPAAPITNTFALEVLTALILVLVALLVRSRLSVERPGATQQAIELSWNAIGDHGEEVIGHGGKRFLPYLFTLFFFILIGNLMGLVPSLDSPTAGIETTLGLAVATFLYYHFIGVKELGPRKYARALCGPMIFMAPLEVISQFARILSLSVRLFANMFAGEMITTIFLALLPIAGIVFMGLHVFIAILQAYIFMVLAMVYLAGATAEEH